LSRTLFVGLAMIETMAIYCLVIALLPIAVIRAGILAAVTRWPPRDWSSRRILLLRIRRRPFGTVILTMAPASTIPIGMQIL
jgi:hypothetical protein